MTQLNSNFDTLSLLKNLVPQKASDVFSQPTYQKYNASTGDYDNIPIIPGEQGLERERKQITDTLVGLVSSNLKADLVEVESRALLEQREKALRFLERFGTRQETEWFGDRISETTLSFVRGKEPTRGGMTPTEVSILGGVGGERGLLGLEQSSQGAQSMLAQNLIASKSPVDQTKFGMGSKEERERLSRQSNTFTYPGKIIDVVTTGEDVLSVVPFVSHAAPTVHDALLKKDHSFNAKDLLTAYANSDPEFMAFLKQTNMDLTALAGTKNLEHFNYVLNTHYANISLSESMKAYDETRTSLSTFGYFAADQLKASFGSIDFGGQVLLAAATAGVGNLLALGVTATSATASRTLSTGTQVARIVTMAERLGKIGKAVKTTGDYLPLNLPSTVLKKLGWEAATGGLKYGSGAALGHMITGFAEETMTDILNQSVEKYGYGTRVSFDYGQMLQAGVLGGLMEPILGVGFKVAFLPITITSYYNQKKGWTSSAFGAISTKVFNVSPARIRELDLYRRSLMPSDAIEKMSPEERSLYVATTARMVAIEASLNESTGNAFGKLENNTPAIGIIQAILSSTQSSFTGNQQTLVEIALQLDGMLKKMNASTRTVDGKWQRASRQMELENQDIFTEDSNGFVVFTKDGVETLMVALAAETVTNPAHRTAVVADAMNALIRRRIAEKVKDDKDTEESLNSKVDQELENDTDTAKKARSGVMNTLRIMAVSFTLQTNDPNPTEKPDIETTLVEPKSADVVDAEQRAQENVADLVNKAIEPPQSSLKGLDTMADLLGSAYLQQSRDATDAVDQAIADRPQAAPTTTQAEPVAAQAEPVAAPAAPTPTAAPEAVFTATPTDAPAVSVKNLTYAGGTPAGWKLHLNVSNENEDAVNKYLTDKVKNKIDGGVKFKKGKSSQAGKSFTVYVGSRDKAMAVAQQINAEIGNLLLEAEGDVLKDDVNFDGKVWGRFDIGPVDKEFHQYGIAGIPFLNDDMGNLSFGGRTDSKIEEAKNKAHNILVARYGEFYTGTSAAPATPAPAAAVPATVDMARALETLQAHPELVKLLNIICK